MQRLGFLAIVLASLGSSAAVHADRVHLAGGSVIEGKATRQGDKVVVEVESGEVTLPAESVTKIEASESVVQVFEQRLAKLGPRDVKGMLALADYCHDHEMSDREQQMLRKVIDVEPDHKEARARLGYVRTDAGWVTHEEQMRAQGMVLHDGQWISREQLGQIERQEADAAAARNREQQALELQQRRDQLDRQQRQSEAEAQERAAAARYSYGYGNGYGYGYGYSSPVYPNYGYGYSSYPTYTHGWWAPSRCSGGRCTAGVTPPYAHPFPIAGVRDPATYFPRWK